MRKVLKKINIKIKQKIQYLLSRIKELNISKFLNFSIANTFVKLFSIF